MEVQRRQSPFLLLGFITFSLLIHLLLLLLPGGFLDPAAPPPEPVYIEVRPPEPPPRTRERELDIPVPEREIPRDTPARRLGPADQMVKEETAPKGDAPEDRQPSIAIPATPSPPVRPKPAPTPTAPPVAQPRPEAAVPPPIAERRADSAPPPPTPAPEEEALRERPAAPAAPPDQTALTTLPSRTTARLEGEARTRERAEVAEG
jgi:protein TonB